MEGFIVKSASVLFLLLTCMLLSACGKSSHGDAIKQTHGLGSPSVAVKSDNTASVFTKNDELAGVPAYEKKWVSELNRKLIEVENNFKKKAKIKPDIDNLAESFSVNQEIINDIYQLWTLSRICLFLDIDNKEIMNNAQLIIFRYREFIAKNKDVNYDELTLMNMNMNIDAIQTDYYKHAIMVIQNCISFDGNVYSTSSSFIVPKDNSQKEFAKKAMEQWYQNNKNYLVWKEATKSFVKVRGNDPLPKEVVELFVVGKK